ncbi:hypothetical protein A3D00_01765 [Candidatus Woesebacteria bacterium RIFCSPHIGHO2_02_FULL_38_9]|uniref:rRNA maturation RNase YbeY n=1 Tax=Candidatus Woesebacteria bacterium RIFCSPHIGHO2_01_FULL_39_28 TaxID=1802496 RepID=A0A1F7YFK4_9BACT|nr:MAG: hypothetical protein A2627_03685 [Candidatus Woesebacteria bacterium RIFCSPHIGHO2_01_FULL_39_28]OGM33655.1 MAG: hypothetical protein A3D00_01765 [Candidatus Woesebacteria bacterium RIFCSPHIGHO2_02_FULL_38_9]OGM58524.1 MAG: hypothetical protein A3A50_00695 [Candidatus Woesebacteria bacterium RIFCSPLOWO2_01_FULL_38_20]
MISVEVYKQSNFPVSSAKIKKAVTKVLTENGIISDSEVSVAIVGDKKMAELGYKEHPVLSYLSTETKKMFVFPPDGKMHLGEIVISFKYAVDESNETGRLIDEIVVDWAEHGAMHLVGKHHD